MNADTDEPNLPPTAAGGLLRSLSHRNFRLFFLGQGTSLIGTWMQQVAMMWLVFELTGSSFWLGLTGFAGQIPSFFLAPVAGVLVEGWNRHRLLLVTQTGAMLQAFALASLALAGVIEVWQILWLSLYLGVFNAFDMTTRQTFLIEMVTDRANLGNAIALNSSLVNGARLFGPALAGLVLAETSAGVCFLLNGVSFLAVLAALLAMRLEPRPAVPRRPSLLQGLREGLVYAYGFTPIRSILILLSIVSLMGLSFTVLLPVYATEVLDGNAATFGFLSAASGLGALAAAIYLASRRSVLGLGRWITLMPGLLGAGMVGLAFCKLLWLSLLLLVVTGFAGMAQMASCNTLLQTIVDDSKRGRVMSLYTMSFLGMAPLGSLLAGSLANRYGVDWTFLFNGVVCVATSVVFAPLLPRLREKIRPIYLRMGILPGVGSAANLTVPPEEQ